ncbi:MAG: hypothetical protein KAV87_42650 [Desulfobacteraceae bacterium]|nr:hypothetical protein [Desulfobacteraceae bacterium]
MSLLIGNKRGEIGGKIREGEDGAGIIEIVSVGSRFLKNMFAGVLFMPFAQRSG